MSFEMTSDLDQTTSNTQLYLLEMVLDVDTMYNANKRGHGHNVYRGFTTTWTQEKN